MEIVNEDEINILHKELDLASKSLIKKVVFSILTILVGPYLILFIAPDLAWLLSFPAESFGVYFIQAGKVGLVVLPFLIYYIHEFLVVKEDYKNLKKEVIEGEIIGNRIYDNDDYRIKEYYLQFKILEGKKVLLKVTRQDYYTYLFKDKLNIHVTPKAKIGLKLEKSSNSESQESDTTLLNKILESSLGKLRWFNGFGFFIGILFLLGCIDFMTTHEFYGFIILLASAGIYFLFIGDNVGLRALVGFRYDENGVPLFEEQHWLTNTKTQLKLNLDEYSYSYQNERIGKRSRLFLTLYDVEYKIIKRFAESQILKNEALILIARKLGKSGVRKI